MFNNVGNFSIFLVSVFDVRAVSSKAYSHCISTLPNVLFAFTFATEQKINKIFCEAGEVVPYFKSFFCYVASE